MVELPTPITATASISPCLKIRITSRMFVEIG